MVRQDFISVVYPCFPFAGMVRETDPFTANLHDSFIEVLWSLQLEKFLLVPNLWSPWLIKNLWDLWLKTNWCLLGWESWFFSHFSVFPMACPLWPVVLGSQRWEGAAALLCVVPGSWKHLSPLHSLLENLLLTPKRQVYQQRVAAREKTSPLWLSLTFTLIGSGEAPLLETVSRGITRPLNFRVKWRWWPWWAQTPPLHLMAWSWLLHWLRPTSSPPWLAFTPRHADSSFPEPRALHLLPGD